MPDLSIINLTKLVKIIFENLATNSLGNKLLIGNGFRVHILYPTPFSAFYRYFEVKSYQKIFKESKK